MPIPSEIRELINRLEQELDEIEQKATDGLNLVRPLLSLFGDNAILIQYFAFLNAALLSVQTSKRQVEIIVESISPDDITVSEVREAGEDLGTLLGKTLETKIRVDRIIENLEELQ